MRDVVPLYKTAEVRDVRRIGGGAGCGGEVRKKSGWGVSWTNSSLRHQRRLVDDCSPGRGEMAQDGGTKGGTFHGEMDRCSESQGWTAACSSTPERDR